MPPKPKRGREGYDLTPEASAGPTSLNPEVAAAMAANLKRKASQAPAAMGVPEEADGAAAAAAPLLLPGVVPPGRVPRGRPVGAPSSASAAAAAAAAAPLIAPRAAVGAPSLAAAAPKREVGPGAVAAPREKPIDDDGDEIEDEPSGEANAAAAAAAAAPIDEDGEEEDDDEDLLVSFWDNYLGPGFPERYRTDAIKVLQDLAYLDSIHDFWKERGNKKAVTDEDEDETTDILEDRLVKVKESLVETIKKYKGTAFAGYRDIGSILTNATGGLVRSPSGIEDNVLEYFKLKYKPFNEPEGSMTINDIVTSWKFDDPKFNKDWTKYSGAVSQLPNTLDIVFDAKVKNIKVLDQKQLGTLGFFLLAFLNPSGPNPGTIPNVSLTFDMAPRDIGKIFERFSQVKNGIYPQNVADSASTSFTALNGRSMFFRANYSLSTSTAKQQPVVQTIRSNAYTHEKYTFEFEDADFNEKNRFAFSIVVKDKTNRKVVAKIPFGGRSEQGPSVNYLMNIIATDLETATSEMLKGKVKVANLSNLKNIIEPDILFDLKRLGDQEQMLITNSIGVSGDRFAIALRRVLQRAAIFHSTRGIRPSRGVTALSLADMEKQARQFRTNSIMGKLKVIAQIVSPGGALAAAEKGIAEMKAEIQAGMTNGIVFMPSVKISGKDLTQDVINKDYTQIASTVASYILRKKMEDIYKYIESLETEVKELIKTVPGLDPAGCTFIPNLLTDPKTSCPPGSAGLPGVGAATPAAIDAALNTLEAFIEKSAALKKMRVPLFVSWDAGANKMGLPKPEPIYIQLFKDNRLLKGAASNRFNFSAGPFIHPETGLQAVIGRLLRLSQSDRPKTVEKQINALLIDYFRARDAITGSFFDEGLKNLLEGMTDIDNGLDTTRVVREPKNEKGEPINDGKRGLIEVVKGILDAMNPPAPVAASASASAAAAAAKPIDEDGEEEDDDSDNELGGGGKQRGGAGDFRQFRDMHDLFAELCLEAGTVLELERERTAKPNAEDDEEEDEDLVPSAAAAAAAAAAPGKAAVGGPDSMDEREDKPAVSDDLVDALNDIEVRWVLGIDEIRIQSEDDYGVPYEPTTTVDLITFILSFRTTEKGDGIDHLGFSPGRRDIPEFETIRAKLLTHVPVERYILQLLAKTGKKIVGVANANADKDISNPSEKISENTYAAPAKWRNNLGNIILYGTDEGVSREVSNLLKGGGLEGGDNTQSNDELPPSGGVPLGGRRGLYARLQ